MAMATQHASVEDLEELEAALTTRAYLVGEYVPPLQPIPFALFHDLSETEWQAAERLLPALRESPAHVLQDRMTALALVGDAATLAEIQALAITGDQAGDAIARGLTGGAYRAFARAWWRWREATFAALRDGRLRSPALEERAELLRALARRLAQLPSGSADCADAEARRLRAALSGFDVTRGLGFLAR